MTVQLLDDDHLQCQDCSTILCAQHLSRPTLMDRHQQSNNHIEAVFRKTVLKELSNLNKRFDKLEGMLKGKVVPQKDEVEPQREDISHPDPTPIPEILEEPPAETVVEIFPDTQATAETQHPAFTSEAWLNSMKADGKSQKTQEEFKKYNDRFDEWWGDRSGVLPSQ